MTSKAQTFTVSLKVGGDNMKLLIAVDDSVDEVFESLKSAYPTCANKKIEILEKLITSLKLQLQNQMLNPNLLQSISQFLERNHKPIQAQQKNQKHNNSVSKQVKIENSDKVFKLSRENKENQKFTFKKRMSYQSQNQQYLHIPKKKCSVPSKPKPFTPIKTVKSKQVGNSLERPTTINPDVVKACQIIMKKTQNTDMKQMAKDFLKEKGYLKQEKEKSMCQKKKKNNFSDLEQSNHHLEIDQIATESAQNAKNQAGSQTKCQTSAILANITTLNVCRQNNRFGKYKYLQSSLMNESLSKDYQSFHKQDESSIFKSSETKQKKYSYLE